MPSKPDVFLSCAEASGDMHAAGLAKALIAKRHDLTIEAVGGPRLEAAGVPLVHDTVTRARFGVTSFLRAGEVWSMLRTLRRLWQASPPGLVVACDSWTMNKHVLALAREVGSETMYYVSPQVWASRPGRVEKLRQLATRVACILPFEEAWLRERGVDATYVGHPLFDDQPAVASRETSPSVDGPVRLALNFGSRLNTVKANLPGLVAAADQLRKSHDIAAVTTPTVAATHDLVTSLIPSWIEARRDAFDDVLGEADLCLTTSGTATLHTAAHGVPMVIVYRGSQFLWEIIGKRIVQTRTFGLVNLLHPSFANGTRVVDEHIPWSGDPAPIVASAERLMDDRDAFETVRRRLAEVVDPLRDGHAGQKAAAIALELLNRELA
ncbi:MAG: hypothetical protein AAGI46_07110 [Planctomycetota bacterium]